MTRDGPGAGGDASGRFIPVRTADPCGLNEEGFPVRKRIGPSGKKDVAA